MSAVLIGEILSVALFFGIICILLRPQFITALDPDVLLQGL